MTASARPRPHAASTEPETYLISENKIIGIERNIGKSIDVPK